ncbi:MAG TPA: MarR family transcriptional regulator [Longimicrobiales bacterium]|nr:MarR family transcriptional regulator [Longimicrobiales bacterium]
MLPEDPTAPAASRLQQEIRQTRPFRSRTHEAFLALLRTADVARGRFAGVFDREGITFQQYNVLRILRGAGEAGLPTLEIGARMIERTPGVTRMVDRLEGKGWVRRERHAEDRRRVWCRITREGLELLARLDAPVDAADAAVFAGMSEAEVEALILTLDRLREQLGAAQDSRG